jgi:hypothetical protein
VEEISDWWEGESGRSFSLALTPRTSNCVIGEPVCHLCHNLLSGPITNTSSLPSAFAITTGSTLALMLPLGIDLVRHYGSDGLDGLDFY